MSFAGAEVRPGSRDRGIRQSSETRTNELLQRELNPETRYKRYVNILNALVKDEKGLPELGMSAGEIKDLATHASRQLPHVVGQDRRLNRLQKSLPRGIDPFERVISGDLKSQPKFHHHTQVELDTATRVFLHVAPRLIDTPKALFPEPAPEGAVLTESMLDTAFYYTLLSGEGSVASQIEDPIEFARGGAVINLGGEDYDSQITHGYKIPVQLLEILKTLKYAESEKVFSDWVLRQCSKTQEDFEVTMRFLRIFINFTSTFDSLTHMQLWKPRIELPNREREFLLKSFETLLKTVTYSEVNLRRAGAGQEVLKEFGLLETLIKFRFGEVFNPAHKTSHYTVAERALTPTPEDFAEFAFSILRATKRDDQKRVAEGLVKLAESIGIRNTEPLLRKLETLPALRQAFIAEAHLTGLIKHPSAVKTVLENLLATPWYDLAERNLSKEWQIDNMHLEVFVFTGTFGPFTKGHKEVVQKLCDQLDTLSKTDEEGREFQRIILITPMLDSAGIPDYPKISSRVGTLDERVSSMLLHLSSGQIDRNKVFVTTAFQPDPMIPKSVEERVRDTVRTLGAKAVIDLKNAKRSGDIEVSYRYVLGADGLKWEKPDELKLADKDNQPPRVRRQGGSVFVRRGWLLRVLENLERMREVTGIERVVLTPVTPFSSSTSAIKEILTTGSCDFFEPGAQSYVYKHWNQKAIERRRGLEKAEHYRTVNQIYLSLVEEMAELARVA